MSETILKVQHLGKSFGNNEILKDIDFSVKPKDVTCIIGPIQRLPSLSAKRLNT